MSEDRGEDRVVTTHTPGQHPWAGAAAGRAGLVAVTGGGGGRGLSGHTEGPCDPVTHSPLQGRAQRSGCEGREDRAAPAARHPCCWAWDLVTSENQTPRAPSWVVPGPRSHWDRTRWASGRRPAGVEGTELQPGGGEPWRGRWGQRVRGPPRLGLLITQLPKTTGQAEGTGKGRGDLGRLPS